MSHSTKVQREFAKQASGFANPSLTLARADYLEWMVGYLPLQKDSRVLDVAAGSGHLTRAIAPRVAWILAVDLTTEMLRELKKHTAAQEISNVGVLRGLAETLPIRDAAFDLVVSRFAFHHFEQPTTVLREMIRTCMRGGSIGIIDLMSPDEPELAERYNSYERTRDPSHARALSSAELMRLLQNAGLAPVSSVERDVEVDVDAWLDLTKTPAAAAEQIRNELVADLQGGPRTGMRPFRRNEGLMFLQRWKIAVARS